MDYLREEIVDGDKVNNFCLFGAKIGANVTTVT